MRRTQPPGGLVRHAPGLLIAVILMAGFAPPHPASAFDEAEVRAMVANEQDPARFPGAGGIWLGRERSISIDGEGSAQINEHLVAQVFDPAWARKTFEPFSVTYWSEGSQLRVLLARVWHSLERAEDLDRGAVSDSLHPSARGVRSCAYFRNRRLAFPPLARGDRVEIVLHWTVPNTVQNLNMNWFAESFGAPEPVVEQRLCLDQPAAAEPTLKSFGAVQPPQILERNGFRRRIWEVGNLTGGRSFQRTPTSDLPLPGDSLRSDAEQVVMSSIGGWNEAGPHYGLQWEESWNKRNDGIDRAASGLINDFPDPIERARACESFLRKQIRTVPVPVPLLPLRPFEAAEVMADSAGTPRDKTCLLVSLLRASGIKAYPVLLRNHGGPWDRELPCLAELDRYLVLIQIPGDPDLWLDPTGEPELRVPSEGLAFPGGEGDAPAELTQGLIPFPGLGLAVEKDGLKAAPATPAGRFGSRR